MVLKFGVGDERRRAVLLFWEVASDYSSDEAGAFRRGSIHHGCYVGMYYFLFFRVHAPG
jgi:hypothetical protein